MNAAKLKYMAVFEQYDPHASKRDYTTKENSYKCILPNLSNQGFSHFDKLVRQQQQQTQSTVPGLIKSKRKSVVIKSLTCLRTQKDCDEIMEDLFSISDSSLSSDEEQDVDEEGKDQLDQQLARTTTAATTQAPMQAPAHMLLPHLADYLVKHPDEPPENFLFKHYHRLSLEDLHYPIEKIGHLMQSCNSLAEGVYITMDEFEALQGFSRFFTIH